MCWLYRKVPDLFNTLNSGVNDLETAKEVVQEFKDLNTYA